VENEINLPSLEELHLSDYHKQSEKAALEAWEKRPPLSHGSFRHPSLNTATHPTEPSSSNKAPSR
jgi:hypothetical protein